MTDSRTGKKSPRHGADGPALAASGPDRRATVVVIVLLGLISAAWIVLAMGVFFVGPAEWDDNQYCDIAVMPRTSSFVVNRYIHIWSLRIFYLLIDSRRTATGLYGALTVVGSIWMAFFLGRRISGVACGLLAAVLVPFYPVLLKYLTVPYCDQPMVFWSGAALVCCLAASGRRGSRAGWIAALLTGLFCFLAVKSKETGLGVLVPVFYLLLSGDGKAKALGQWLAGVLIGWVVLTLMDGGFAGDPWFSWRYSSYFPDKTPDPNPTIRMGAEYLQFLTSREFLAFSLLGLAGALVSFRHNRAVRCVALWLLGVIVFQSFISCRYRGIQALDRYCVGIGVPLVILSAHWIVTQWRRPKEKQHGYSPSLIAALLVIVGPALYGLFATGTADPDPRTVVSRFSIFLIPASITLLFAVPWLTSWRPLLRLSLAAVVVIACTLSVCLSLRYSKYAQAKLAPWVELANELDGTDVGLAVWKMRSKPLNPMRIAWRSRALSSQPPDRIQVRKVESLGDIADDEWLFTDTKWWRSDTPERQQMVARGWKPFISGAEGRQGFVVCRRGG